MQTARLISTVIMAMILMGCPPPVSDNPAAPASEVNAPAPGGDNPAPGDPEPKAIVVPYVSAGSNHSMILKTDDTLWAFGDNQYGQLGNGNRGVQLTPVQVMAAEGEPMTEVDQISVGGDHSMILKTNGDLWAVGRNNKGQLGDNSKTDRFTPVQVKTAEGPAMTEVAQVSAGNLHTMILKKNSDLWAVGNNSFGQLGNDDSRLRNKKTPVQVMTAAGEPMTEVDQVSAGDSHSMILKENSNLWSTGFNNAGQLGNNTTDAESTPIAVKNAQGEPMTEVDQISAGGYHTMILKENGSLWAVGKNDHGQLGDGTKTRKKTPVQVMIAEDRPMTEVAQVSAGVNHTIIVKRNGSLWAFGSNNKGQLGNGDVNRADKLFPVEITVP